MMKWMEGWMEGRLTFRVIAENTEQYTTEQQVPTKMKKKMEFVFLDFRLFFVLDVSGVEVNF
jgi:hypothetical protein